MRNLSVFLFILLFALSADALGPGDDQCQAESNKPAPAPPGQLEGINNYWMVALDTSMGKCTRLRSPSVTIKVHSDMSVDQNGFDFQLNMLSLASHKYPNGVNISGNGPGLVSTQQYIVNVYPSQDGNPNRTDIFGMVENFPTQPPGMSSTPPGPCWQNYTMGANCDQGSDVVFTEKVGPKFYLATLTNTPIPTLPDGTIVTITLDTDPKNGQSVTGVTFKVDLPSSATTVVDPNYTYYNGQKISLVDFQNNVGLPLDPSICQGNPPDSRYCPAGFVYNPQNPVSPGNLTVADTSPVTSFTLNIAANQVVSSGAGTITYAISNGILVPLSGSPQDCAAGRGRRKPRTTRIPHCKPVPQALWFSRSIPSTAAPCRLTLIRRTHWSVAAVAPNALRGRFLTSTSAPTVLRIPSPTRPTQAGNARRHCHPRVT